MANQFSIPPATARAVTDEVLELDKQLKSAEAIANEDTKVVPYKDEEQLSEFWNCIMQRKVYSQEIDIRGLKITFRTKTTREVEELLKYMDKKNTNLLSTHDYMYSKALLALTIVKYGEDFIDSGTFNEKLSYVDALPETVLRLLIKAAGKFEKEIEQMEEALYNPNF